MAVDIQIEGKSYLGSTPQTYMVDLSTVAVEQDIAVQQTEASFDVWVWGDFSNGDYTWPITRPKAGQEVVMTNAAGVREFGGILINVDEEEKEPNVMVYHCKCSDYTKWFDRHLVNDTYASGTTAQGLISDIVSKYVNTAGNSRTFTTNNVQQSPPIPLPILQFVYLPPSQVMGQIVQMLGWGWFIDFYRDINFYSTEYAQSPLPDNTFNADDLYTNPALPSSDLGNWVNLQISEDTSQLKNRVYITGIYVAQDQLYSETLTADGTQTVFDLGYEPPNDVAKITVDVNGTAQQIALDLVNSAPGGACEANTAYVNFSAQTVRFCTAPASGDKIKVTYYPMTQTVVMVENPQAQAYMRSIDGTDGVYEFNRMDPSLSAELPTLAQTRASMTLTKYAYPHIQGSFVSYLGGWRVGQYFNFTSNRRFQGEYQNKKFFVIKVSKKLVNAKADWLWRYDIGFGNTPFEF